MPAPLHDIVRFLDTTLEIGRFKDYGPNGLQVEGRVDVTKAVTGVSATMELFEKAHAVGAELIVVHHGLIWGGGLRTITGSTAQRVGFLMKHGISLAGYHLPLDCHPELGNNAGLCDAIGLGAERDGFGDVRGHSLGVAASWPTALSRDDALAKISAGVLGGEPPRFVFPFGPARVSRVGLCTGAASDLMEDAANAGCDLYLTGELAERAGPLAQELQITLVAAGHHATEVFGPQRLAGALANEFPELNVEHIDVPNPL